MFDMMQLLGKMKEVQAKLKEAQENLANITETAEAGAGMVKATVNGEKQVIKLEIDNDIINVDDKEMMQDLIIAAINKALQDVEVLAREEIKKNTSGILPNIPGLDLSNIM